MRRGDVPGTGVPKDATLPFKPTPNPLTIETLAKSERGEDLHSAKDAEDMFDQLGLDDGRGPDER